MPAVYRGRHTPTITFRVNPGEKAEIISLAAQMEVSLSDLVRSGLAMVQAEAMAAGYDPEMTLQ